MTCYIFTRHINTLFIIIRLSPNYEESPVATKKQIILPIAVLVGGIALAAGFSSMKQPPEEKPEQDTRPLVSADVLNLDANTI